MNFSLLINKILQCNIHWILWILPRWLILNFTWIKNDDNCYIKNIITFNILFLFIVMVNTTIIMTWIMMVRRHVTATLSIIGSKWLEHVINTSFLHCSHILRESWSSDWNVQLTDSNVQLIANGASENFIHNIKYIKRFIITLVLINFFL